MSLIDRISNNRMFGGLRNIAFRDYQKSGSGETVETKNFTIVVQPPKRTSQDVGTWIEALKKCEKGQNPTIKDLMDVYTQSLLDDDYITTSQKRIASILNRELIYVNDNGDEYEEVTKWLKSPVFRQFKRDIMETIFWGNSLFEFDYTQDMFNYTLIPRSNVNFITGEVLKQTRDIKGIPYRTPEFEKTTMEIRLGYGLFLPMSLYIILKRNSLGDWANYSELAGNNFRNIRYTGSDPKVRQDAVDALEQAGSSGIIDLPIGVDVDFIRNSSSSSNQLFENFNERMSMAIIRIILGQSMTTLDTQTGSYGKAEIAKEVEGELFKSDRTYFLDLLNYKFIDVFHQFGFKQIGEFRLLEDETMSLSDKLDNDIKLSALIKEGVLPQEYIEERYNIQIDNYNADRSSE